MKRRSFIKLSGMGAGAAVTGGILTGIVPGCSKEHPLALITKPVPVTNGNFSKPLSFPAEANATQVLTAQVTTAAPGTKSIRVLGYQPGQMLGPSFRMRSGEAADILLKNNLSETTNIHWHGLKVPALMDGHPEQIADAGGTFRYQFTLRQRAGLSWYHPHPHGLTGKQVFQGLAGLFIINDAEEALHNLPAGNFELPLVIQDKRFDASGIPYNPSMEEIMAGYMGENILVNGVHAPFLQVATQMYRLRILNGSNARIYNLALSNSADMILIGNDGGLLQQPVTLKDILIGPGERLDVMVNFAGLPIGTEVFLQSKTFTHGGDAQGVQEFSILKFLVNTSAANSFTVPAQLSAIPSLSPSASVKTRKFSISNAMEHHGVPMNDGMPMRHRINGKLYDENKIDETVAANTNEIWEFDNSKGDEPHPMHLHGVFFQVIARMGGRGKIIASESGWKDTVMVMPGEIVKVIIPFDSNPGKFVFHCHNLEHEDDGMMLQYQIK